MDALTWIKSITYGIALLMVLILSLLVIWSFHRDDPEGRYDYIVYPTVMGTCLLSFAIGNATDIWRQVQDILPLIPYIAIVAIDCIALVVIVYQMLATTSRKLYPLLAFFGAVVIAGIAAGIYTEILK